MARTPHPRYYASRGAYYVKLRGKQHLLASGPKDEPDGPTYKAAVLRYSQLVHLAPPSPHDNCQVGAVIHRYMFMLKRDGRLTTHRKFCNVLDPAIVSFGHVKVSDLKPYIVNDWLAQIDTWNSTTKHTAVDCLLTALNWARKEGIISSNPLTGMTKPERLHRDASVVLPELLMDLLAEEANPQLAKLITFLRHTGCRPGEALHAQAKHYQPGLIVLPWNPPPGEWRWKCARHTKRDRVIHLTPALDELVRPQTPGLLFRTKHGRAWTQNNLTVRFVELKRRPRVRSWCEHNAFDPAKIMPYSFRHTYITRMLLAGCPIKLLADLCGTSAVMIERTYGHTHDDREAMRRLFLRFAQSLPLDNPESRPPEER